MKYFSSTISTVIFFFSLNLLIAQGGSELTINTHGGTKFSHLTSILPEDGVELNIKKKYKNVTGSPFFYKYKIMATITTNNGEVVSNVPTMIDYFSEQVIIENELGKDMILDAWSHNKIILHKKDEKIPFKKVDLTKPTKFFEIIFARSDITIYKDVQMDMRESNNLGMTGSGANFSRKKTFFVIDAKGIVHKVKLKKKDLFKFFTPEEQKKMKALVKRKKIKLKKEADFRKVFNSLSE